ncbi:MAG: 23S rRNA (uracil(1939)-C(5))-methyltransferase RlmD [Oscillospiraceae bacterium]|nr:23S rRNA (uracil(1939)-C(5))-methyltransferase RlmD [Oscillospiraceae bacterium]
MSTTSNKRTNPDACPHAARCGGCQLQNMTYDRQLRWKQNLAEQMLGSFGRVEKIIGMDEPTHYRNKVQAAFGRTRDGRIISGVYQSGTHRIVPVDECMTEDRTADAIIADIRRMLPAFRVTVYDERNGTGFLRHVLVKRGFSTGEVMVVLVAATDRFPTKKPFVKALLEKHPEITTLVLNVNSKDTNLVLGEREIVLYGNGWIEDTLCGLTFRISPRSFYQINPIQTEKLYDLAISWAALDGESTVVDAYCGIGTIGLAASRKAGRVIGVELNRSAVKDAIANARRNGITNARFYAGDAGDFMRAMAEDGMKADVVFMDPPRAGSSVTFIESVATLQPKKVVYISCNPETQARDLAVFAAHGYRAMRIRPVDMFPWTKHVETVVLMSRVKD